MNIYAREIIALVCIFVNTAEIAAVSQQINLTKYNIIVRTLFYRDKEGRVLLATGPVSSHTQETLRRHLHGYMDLDNVDQIRMKPAFETVHDIPITKNEAFELLKKNYPKYHVVKIHSSASRKIMNDLRRSSLNEPDWYYNVVSLDFSPAPTGGQLALWGSPHDRAVQTHSYQPPTIRNHIDSSVIGYVEQTPSEHGHVDQSPSNHSRIDLPQTNHSSVDQRQSNHNDVVQPPSIHGHVDHPPLIHCHIDRTPSQREQDNQSPSEDRHVDQPPTKDGHINQALSGYGHANQTLSKHGYDKQTLPEHAHIDRPPPSGHGHVNQPPSNNGQNNKPPYYYYQEPIENTTTGHVLPHGHEKESMHHEPGQYDTTTLPPTTVNYEPLLKNYFENHEPPTNMFPKGRPPEYRIPKKPPKEEVNETPPEHGSKETMPENGSKEKSSDGNLKQVQSQESSDDDALPGQGSVVTLGPSKMQRFIPNDIFYAIEKKCANWSDDCNLYSVNKMGFNQFRHPYLPPRADRWPIIDS